MITDYNVTDYINDEAYEFYNRKSTNWEKHYDRLAEKYEDMEEDLI